MPPDSVPQISLLSAPSTRFDHRHKGPQFAVLPLDLENLTAALAISSRILLEIKFLMVFFRVHSVKVIRTLICNIPLAPTPSQRISNMPTAGGCHCNKYEGILAMMHSL